MSSKSNYILLVEDSKDIRDLIVQFYNDEGYRVEVAVDGKEALSILTSANQLPAVILLDLMMPGMNGFEFKEEQERNSRIADIPVLLMTADPQADARAKKMRAKGYLRKPVAIDTLLAVAQKFCD